MRTKIFYELLDEAIKYGPMLNLAAKNKVPNMRDTGQIAHNFETLRNLQNTNPQLKAAYYVQSPFNLLNTSTITDFSSFQLYGIFIDTTYTPEDVHKMLWGQKKKIRSQGSQTYHEMKNSLGNIINLSRQFLNNGFQLVSPRKNN